MTTFDCVPDHVWDAHLAPVLTDASLMSLALVSRPFSRLLSRHLAIRRGKRYLALQRLHDRYMALPQDQKDQHRISPSYKPPPPPKHGLRGLMMMELTGGDRIVGPRFGP
jgi:hypothetical protein